MKYGIYYYLILSLSMLNLSNAKYIIFSFQGSDPRAATCRGKLQSKRSKLNMEINKELMLRSGAENLFK